MTREKKKEIIIVANDSFLIESNQSKLNLKNGDEEDSKVSSESGEERATWGNRVEFLLACVVILQLH